MKGHRGDLEERERVEFWQESARNISRVAAVVCVEQVQSAAILFLPVFRHEIENEGNPPTLQLIIMAQ